MVLREGSQLEKSKQELKAIHGNYKESCYYRSFYFFNTEKEMILTLIFSLFKFVLF